MYNLTCDTLWCAPSVGYGDVGGVLSQVQTGIFVMTMTRCTRSLLHSRLLPTRWSTYTVSAFLTITVTPLKVASRVAIVFVINSRMLDSAFIPYKCWEKLAQRHSAWPIDSGLTHRVQPDPSIPAWPIDSGLHLDSGLHRSSGCSTSDQASSWLVFGRNPRHCSYDHDGSNHRSYTDSNRAAVSVTDRR